MFKKIIQKAVSLFKRKKVVETAFLSNRIIPTGTTKEFISVWNTKFPIDYWWRKKHNIPFGSKKHNEMSLIDMRLEYEEDGLYEEMKHAREYVPNKGDFFKEKAKERELTEEEKFQDFLNEDIDLSKFDNI